MSLSDGDPATADDVWLRILIEKRWLLDNGGVSQSAFKSARVFKAPEPELNRGWNHEVSGRLRSLATDIVQNGQTFCQNLSPKRDFPGIAYVKVDRVRTQSRRPEQVRADVYRTDALDPAHSDLVFFDSTENDFSEMRDWLQDTLRSLSVAEIAKLQNI
jgi:hypothetical protein